VRRGLFSTKGEIALGSGIAGWGEHEWNIMIEGMKPEDWEEVRAIYLEGIATGDATFEAASPDWGKWDTSHMAEARLVARVDGRVAGWAALSRISARRAYAGVFQVSIYVGAKYRGRGIGFAWPERRLLFCGRTRRLKALFHDPCEFGPDGLIESRPF